MEKEKAVIILSGGMDSTTLLYDIISKGYDVYALSMDYGQKHKKELEYATATCKKLNIPHKILDLSPLNEIAPSALTRKEIEVPEGHYAADNMKITVVPARNLVMLSMATAYAIGIGAKKIFYGAHAGDHQIYADCRTEFALAMARAIELADFSAVKLIAPYTIIDKGEIVKRGIKLNVDYSLTWSCYKGGDKPCGKCGTCVERLEAFAKAGIKDPLQYEVDK